MGVQMVSPPNPKWGGFKNPGEQKRRKKKKKKKKQKKRKKTR